MAGYDDVPSPEINVNVPSVARMYDFALGGKDNYASDREAVAQAEEMMPGTTPLCVTNRGFLKRAVHVLAQDYGIRQFIDHGSGLPTQDNVHQVAQRVDERSRVVYVDNDPIVLAHGRALLAENNNTAVIQADMCSTDLIFGYPEVRRLIDLDQPVAALFVSVLHCITDESDPAGLVRRVTERLPSGSFLVINQLINENAARRAKITDFMVTATQGNWGRVRQVADVEGYFEGLEVLEPGLVEINDWRPDSDLVRPPRSEDWIEFGGVARKP